MGKGGILRPYRGSVYTVVVFDVWDGRVTERVSHVVVGRVRVGRKYVHVLPFMEEDGEFVENPNWGWTRYELARVRILRGVRRDVIERFEEWRRRVVEWSEAQKIFLRELENRLHEMRMRELDRWERENPYPRLEILDGK